MRSWAATLLTLCAILFALPALAAGPTFPPLTGRVVDDANILSPQTETELTGKLEALEKSTGRQVVVATLPSLQGYEIEDYGYQLGRAWGIGQKGTNTGAMLIVAPNDRKVRVEVGYGLEPILTDALSSVIIQSAVLPKFRTGDLEGGVKAGTDAIIQQLSLPDEEAKAKAQEAFQVSEDAAEKGAGPSPILILLVLFVVIVILSQVFGRRRRGRGGGGLGSALPWIILNGMMNSGRGGGGGWTGGGGGGGGFSGGGGSFGGGGSSGSW